MTVQNDAGDAELGLEALGELQETILHIGADRVATITLNRPRKINAFNQAMLDDFDRLWRWVRETSFVHAVVVQGEGERGFCSGVDVVEGYVRNPNVWHEDDPGIHLGPRINKVWKPVICAVHGVTAGGAFYWLNEADVIICAEGTTFFDPHVSFGMVAALEPIGLSRRIPLGEVLRMALVGNDERISAARALQIGLVTEVVEPDHLRARAHELAAAMASKPAAAIQGTVRAIWESLDEGRSHAIARGLGYPLLGNPIGMDEVDRASQPKREPFIR
ncbi:MAG TPA: enoyl-CoA hydratase/isomerase family protein [Acidimicrobiales bacterium]